MIRRDFTYAMLLAMVPLLGGCGASAAPQEPALPTLIVHKNASCGCCGAWVEHMRRSGFAVKVENVDNLVSIKERVGIPPAMGSCHTAEVDGYFVEGHVPSADVKRLLTEHPHARGLTVPGMPVGSPGMESASGEVKPYDVYLVADDGTVSVFAHHAAKDTSHGQ